MALAWGPLGHLQAILSSFRYFPILSSPPRVLYNLSAASMNILFFGTPTYVAPVIHALIEMGHTVKGVITPPDRPAGRGRSMEAPGAKSVAQELGLPVFQPTSIRTPEIKELIASLEPHLILVAAYGKILPPDILSFPRHGCLNLHPSFLPLHRGPSPVVAALLEGATTTGISLMLMDAGIDSGSIVAQQEETILQGDTGGALTARLFHKGADMMREFLPLWMCAKIHAVPQDDSKATYTKKLSKADGVLDLSLPAKILERRVRAFIPWPTCNVIWGGKRLKVLGAHPMTMLTTVPMGTPVGTVVAVTGSLSPGIVTGQGILVLEILQLEGKKPVAAEEFLQGHPDFLGALLPS
jgi:methionyl-tRNA formyltransferase